MQMLLPVIYCLENAQREVLFNQKWLENCGYSSWLKQYANKCNGRCSVCSKTFDISNMGEAAVCCHRDGSKHNTL